MKTRFILLTLLAVSCGLYSQTQPKGYALLIGLGKLNDQAYQNRYGRAYGSFAVSGIGNDLAMMKDILSTNAYSITELTNEKATNTAVLGKIREIGKQLKPGDHFLLYFTGHGDFIRDQSGDELSGFDQVLVTYNDFLLDDSLHVLFKKYFQSSVNMMIVDACHSGTSDKMKFTVSDFEKVPLTKNKNKFYTESVAVKKDTTSTPCSYIQTVEKDEPYTLFYFGAVGDNSKAKGDAGGGLLTNYMYQVYSNSIRKGIWESYTYQSFACEVSRMTDWQGQKMQYHETGPLSNTIKNQTPFKITKP
jgi:hypothetical protein